MWTQGGDWQQGLLRHWRWKFLIEPGAFMYADEPWCHQNFAIEVLPMVHRLGDWYLGSDAEWETFGYFRNLFFDLGAAEGNSDEEEGAQEAVAAKSWANDPRMVNFWAYHEGSGAGVLAEELGRHGRP